MQYHVLKVGPAIANYALFRRPGVIAVDRFRDRYALAAARFLAPGGRRGPFGKGLTSPIRGSALAYLAKSHDPGNECMQRNLLLLPFRRVYKDGERRGALLIQFAGCEHVTGQLCSSGDHDTVPEQHWFLQPESE